MQQRFELEVQHHKGREGQKHFWLKWQARKYLRDHQAYAVAAEVDVPKRNLPETRVAYSSWDRSGVIDVMGIQHRHHATGRSRRFRLYSPEGQELVSVGIEVKVSRDDFHSGYHDRACQFNYLLIPAGLLALEEVPDWVGLMAYGDKPGLDLLRRAREIDDPAVRGERAAIYIALALTSEWRNNALIKIDNPFRSAEYNKELREAREAEQVGLSPSGLRPLK